MIGGKLFSKPKLEMGSAASSAKIAPANLSSNSGGVSKTAKVAPEPVGEKNTKKANGQQLPTAIRPNALTAATPSSEPMKGGRRNQGRATRTQRKQRNRGKSRTSKKGNARR